MFTKTVLIIITFTAITLVEIPGLVEKGYWRELGVFILFFLPAFLLSILVGLDITIPNPIPVINQIISTLVPFSKP